SRIDTAFTVIIHSLGSAMATFTAQNYGANKLDRIRKGLFHTSIIAYIYCIAVAILFFVFGRHFASLFLKEASLSTIDLSYTYLMVNSSFYILLATLVISRATLQGMSNNFAPTLAGIIELIMRFFAAMFFSKVAGFTGLCFACPLAWLGSLFPLVIYLVIAFKDKFAQKTTPPP
ncbi:MAG: MATE family efflux transporter, partial [Candidatus Cloacimonetes bacterium]|nr:MATE family efflux transporter [Candidatus Cloacimonadota bacterium]